MILSNVFACLLSSDVRNDALNLSALRLVYFDRIFSFDLRQAATAATVAAPAAAIMHASKQPSKQAGRQARKLTSEQAASSS